MRNFTFKALFVVVCMLCLTFQESRAESSLADSHSQMTDSFQKTAHVLYAADSPGVKSLVNEPVYEYVCLDPIIGFTAIRYTNFDGTDVLHTQESVIPEAKDYVRSELHELYPGLVEGVDWEFADEYQVPELCGENGWLIYSFKGDVGEPFFCVLEINWNDIIKESNCPEDLLLTEGPSNLADIQVWLASVSAEAYYPTSPLSITNNFNSATMLVPGTHTVTFSASVCNSFPVRLCQRSITIEAATVDMPEAVCQNVTLYLDANGLASLTPELIDGGSSNGTLSIEITDFSCDDIGENEVTLTVTSVDNSSLTSTCTAIVTVVDNLVPDFGRGNKSIRVTITEGEEYLLEDLSTLFPASDNCGGDLTYTQTPQAGTSYTIATTEEILLGAEDETGNYSEIVVKLTLRVRKVNNRKGGGGPTATAVSATESGEVTLKSASAEILFPATESNSINVWPNPFSDRVSFEFVPMERANARLEIFSMSGQKVAMLINRTVEKDQLYRLEFTPGDLNEGFYFYRLQLGSYTDAGKIIRQR